MQVKKINKFVNNPENVVDDSIRGLILTNDHLATLNSCHRVVIRSDIDHKNNASLDKVSIVTGGGSGHEPFAAGFVGKGLLTAAVCGNIFASPPTSHITDCLIATRSKCGTAVFVINYTGDRLNFGLAVERFNASKKKEDGEAELVLIGDDVALESNLASKQVGRRGLAGAILLLKIAGAMAETGKNLELIVKTTKIINDNLGTMSVSLSACSIPGKGAMFELGNDQMELGLGIHGEPGYQRSEYQTARQVSRLLIDKLRNSEKLKLKKGDRLIVLLNNLGGTSIIELNVLAGELYSYIGECGYVAERFYIDTVMTSLNGHGISVTILKLTCNDWLSYLDIESSAPAWRMTKSLPKQATSLKEIAFVMNKENGSFESGATLSKDEAERVEIALRKACIAIAGAVDELNRLDGSAGDGDCGTTLKCGGDAILKSLNDKKLCCHRPLTLFNQISKIFEDEVGGTAGALYALMFSAASASFSSTATSKDWHSALTSGLNAVMKYGQAKPGHRSMVDPLYAAANSFSVDKPEKKHWELAVEKAKVAAKSTCEMLAQVGRASYTATSVQKEADAGAIAVTVWMKAIYDSLYS